MKTIKIIMLLPLLFSATYCFADTVTVKAGDVLTCDIHTKYYGLSTPYQNLFFIDDYIADIMNVPDQSALYTITTINNDFFTGHLINPQIEALMEIGLKADLPADTIKDVHLDNPGETKGKKTTIFVMKNGDRFSGQMITSRLNINTDQEPLAIDGKNMKRIVFITPSTKLAEIYMNDGSIHTGVISEDLLSIKPDSTSPMNINISQFQSIQFNAFKYIKKTITPAEYNDPELCLFKCHSGFLAECCPSQTTAVLLPGPDGHVGEIEVQTEGGLQILSEPGQAVVVKLKNEPPPQPTVFDEQKIRAMFGKALDAEPPVPKKFVLYFKTDSTNLIPDSKALIPGIIQCIRERNSFDIHVNGYSDRKGTYEYNLALSLKRATYIQELLVKSGIEDKYITTTSTGEGNPLIPTADDVAEPRNRRVEVIVR